MSMSDLIDTLSKPIAFFKYLKPKTITFGAIPQTIKDPSVTVERIPGDDTFFLGSDGEEYVEQKILCKRAVFSNGQRMREGDVAYFKLEPIEWEIAGYCYEYEQIKDRKGRLKKTLRRKTDKRYYVAKYVLADKNTRKQIHVYEEDEPFVPYRDIHTIGTAYDFSIFYCVGGRSRSGLRRNYRKKATDYAIACGVTVKGRKAYHTLMFNNMCVYPKGKVMTKHKYCVCGEVVYFTDK
ncbi:MAG: hypothetical protein ACI4VK_05000 [Candidatus Coproplasma sp.]